MPAPTLEDYRFFAERRSGGQRLRPKVSLITVVLNAVDTLPRTIESVQAQSFASIEHVVVDGGSTDGTIELLSRCLRVQDYWMTEPDRGISDAMNKGIALARGDYIQFIHADDWLSPTQIEQAVDVLAEVGRRFCVRRPGVLREQPAFIPIRRRPRLSAGNSQAHAGAQPPDRPGAQGMLSSASGCSIRNTNARWTTTGSCACIGPAAARTLCSADRRPHKSRRRLEHRISPDPPRGPGDRGRPRPCIPLLAGSEAGMRSI